MNGDTNIQYPNLITQISLFMLIWEGKKKLFGFLGWNLLPRKHDKEEEEEEKQVMIDDTI